MKQNIRNRAQGLGNAQAVHPFASRRSGQEAWLTTMITEVVHQGIGLDGTVEDGRVCLFA
jgi:hypothetical protein